MADQQPDQMGVCAFVPRGHDARQPHVFGMGILVADRMIVTCAHVVNIALGRDQAAQEDPVGAAMQVWFPFDGPNSCVGGKVDRWFPPGERTRGEPSDVCVIRLNEDAPKAVRRAVLKPHCETRPGDLRPNTFGYRTAEDGSGRSHTTGERAAGEIIGSIPGGLGQFVGLPVTGAAVQGGFSGGGIYDAEQDSVVGMVQKGDKDTTKKIALFIGIPTLKKAIEGIPTPLPKPPIQAEQARKEITDICESLRRTVNPHDGGFRGLGNVKGMDPRSGEWTTAMNIHILATWDLQGYKAIVRGATAWLLAKDRRRNGGWTDNGYDFPGGQNPACTEATTWAILALLAAAPALETGMAEEASAAVTAATDWLLSNQQDNGGWGSCETTATRTSRTYATAMAIITLLSLRKSRGGVYPVLNERPERSLLDGISFLHSTRQPMGWGFIANVVVQLPSTAVALSALLMAQADGYEAAVSPPLSEIAREWLENLENENFDLTESTDVIWFTDPTGVKPDVSSVLVPFNWHDWTLVAAALLGDTGAIQLAHNYITKHVLPRRDQIYPWLSAMSAYGLMIYLRKYYT